MHQPIVCLKGRKEAEVGLFCCTQKIQPGTPMNSYQPGTPYPRDSPKTAAFPFCRPNAKRTMHGDASRGKERKPYWCMIHDSKTSFITERALYLNTLHQRNNKN